MRLKHIAAEKINVRGSKDDNPIEAITRQPVKGRANDGGLRLGEMERDALLSYGMMDFTHESFSERSDGAARNGAPTRMWVDGAGATARFNEGTDTFESTTDELDLEFSRLSTPFCLNVLRHELAQIGIDMGLMTADAAGAHGGDEVEDYAAPET
jgi:DNA-directed RNA polymerase II subunit RPB2